MNIIILANHDLASHFALNYLVPKLIEHKLTIFLSDQVGVNQKKSSALIDLQFFEQQLFNEIVFPAMDAKNKTCSLKHQSNRLTFNGLAQTIKTPITTLNDINQASGLAKIKALSPDLILSIRFGKILKMPVIQIPRYGVLNLHSGLLPQYQGVMATFWAMLNQEKEYGATLHIINDDGIDTGPIVEQVFQPLNLNKSYLENVLALYPLGCEAVLKAINLIALGNQLTTETQIGNSHYYTFPNDSHLEKFLAQRLRLFNAHQIINLIRNDYIQLNPIDA